MATYDSHSAAGQCPLAQPHGIWGAACTGVSHTFFAPGHIAAGAAREHGRMTVLPLKPYLSNDGRPTIPAFDKHLLSNAY